MGQNWKIAEVLGGVGTKHTLQGPLQLLFRLEGVLRLRFLEPAHLISVCVCPFLLFSRLRGLQRQPLFPETGESRHLSFIFTYLIKDLSIY